MAANITKGIYLLLFIICFAYKGYTQSINTYQEDFNSESINESTTVYDSLSHVCVTIDPYRNIELNSGNNSPRLYALNGDDLTLNEDYFNAIHLECSTVDHPPQSLDFYYIEHNVTYSSLAYHNRTYIVGLDTIIEKNYFVGQTGQINNFPIGLQTDVYFKPVIYKYTQISTSSLVGDFTCEILDLDFQADSLYRGRQGFFDLLITGDTLIAVGRFDGMVGTPYQNISNVIAINAISGEWIPTLFGNSDNTYNQETSTFLKVNDEIYSSPEGTEVTLTYASGTPSIGANMVFSDDHGYNDSGASNWYYNGMFLSFASRKPAVYKIKKFNNEYFLMGELSPNDWSNKDLYKSVWQSRHTNGFIKKYNENGNEYSYNDFHVDIPDGNTAIDSSHIKLHEVEVIVTSMDTLLVVLGHTNRDVNPRELGFQRLLNMDGTKYTGNLPFVEQADQFANDNVAFSLYNITQYKNNLYNVALPEYNSGDPDAEFRTFNLYDSYPISPNEILFEAKENFDLWLERRAVNLHTQPEEATHLLSPFLSTAFLFGNKIYTTAVIDRPSGSQINPFIITLEPYDAKPFVTDSFACPGMVKTYTIPKVKYADGYIWEYNGLGGDLQNDGTYNKIDTIVSESAYSIEVKFDFPFTLGEMRVTPFALGQDTYGIDTLVSNTMSMQLVDSPGFPNAVTFLDTTLTCVRDSLILLGYSDTLNVTYSWVDENRVLSKLGNDSLITANNSAYVDADLYYFKAEHTNGCYNLDTVSVTVDMVIPTAIAPPTPWDLTCDPNGTDFTGSSVTPDAILNWGYFLPGANPALYISTTNPINVTVPGSYMLIALDPDNGCIDSTAILVSASTDLPNIKVQGYNNISSAIPIDTLNCYTPQLTLVCESDMVDVTSNWTDENYQNPSTDTKLVTEAGTYYIKITNNGNGCSNNMPIIINEDYTQPNAVMPVENTINCSRDTVLLDGSTIFADTILSWQTPTQNNLQNPLTSNELGWHYFTVTKNDNGCSLTDSINITYVPIIDVFASEDTLICDQTDVDLIVNYEGNLTNVVYAWNNGNSAQTSTYNSGTANEATVIVSADGGCLGYDTVKINIPNAPTATFQSFTPCDGGASGKIIVTPIGGLSPYTYAISSSGSFQTSTLFEGLAIGNYTITVADSIGCYYNFDSEVTEDGLLPEPLFIFSTYNVQADTVVLVDVSSPPADEVNWDFPFEVTVLDDSNLSSPVIILPDTGAFEITMNASYGDCSIGITKWIYSSDYDSTLATNYNQNGIKSVELYPNPNTGVFTVDIEFYKRQHSVTTVQDMNGYSYYWQENNEDDLIVTHNIDLGSNIQPGTYVLKVGAEFDSYYITFIVE